MATTGEVGKLSIGSFEVGAANLNLITLTVNTVSATLTVAVAAIVGGTVLFQPSAVSANSAVEPAVIAPGAVTKLVGVVSANALARSVNLIVILPMNVITGTGTVRSASLSSAGTVTLHPSPVTATGSARTATISGTGTVLLTSDGIGSMRPIQCGSPARVMPATLVTRGLPCDRATGPITVGCVLDNLFRQVGLTADQYDVTDATDEVEGFVVASRASVTDTIDTLLRVYQTDLVEVDGIILAKKRGENAVATLTDADLGYKFHGGGAEPAVSVKRIDSLTVPAMADITYFSVAKDYDTGHQRYSRSTLTEVDDQLTFNTTLVLGDTIARQVVTRLLFELWVHRETFSFILGPKHYYLAPGDPIIVPYAGNLLRVRLIAMDVSIFGPIPCEAVLDEIGVLTQTVTGVDMPDNLPVSSIVLDTNLIVFSTNALRDLDAASVGFYAAFGPATDGDWPGCVLYMSQDNGSTYQPLGEFTDASTYGVATNTLAAPSPATSGLWDRTNVVDVTITAGTPPASTSELDVLAGANTVRVGSEVLQFATVTALGGDNYRLSDLLRGQRGTDAFWATHGASEVVLFLENGGATARIEVGEVLLNKTVLLKAVTAGQNVNDATPSSLLITGDEYKCYAGYALRGTRNIGLDLAIGWYRRTRSGGAWVDFIDADLAETTEAYEIDIYNGLSVVRTISGLSVSTTVYTAADQTTDFGSPQAAIDVKVYQIGRYGRGYPLEGTI